MEKILFMATVQPHLRNYPNRNISEYIKNIRKYLQQKHLFLHLMYDFQKSFINVHAKKHAAGKPTHVSPPNRIPNPGMKFVVVQLFSVSNITSMADTVFTILCRLYNISMYQTICFEDTRTSYVVTVVVVCSSLQRKRG